MAGEDGNDTYVVDSTGDEVTENFAKGIDLILSSVSYTASGNVENLTLTGSENLSGTGNSLDNKLRGNSGDNTLTGEEGADTIFGKGGNDILNGEEGVDKMYGGYGDDIYIVNDSNDIASEGANQGTDLVRVLSLIHI